MQIYHEIFHESKILYFNRNPTKASMAEKKIYSPLKNFRKYFAKHNETFVLLSHPTSKDKKFCNPKILLDNFHFNFIFPFYEIFQEILRQNFRPYPRPRLAFCLQKSKESSDKRSESCKSVAICMGGKTPIRSHESKGDPIVSYRFHGWEPTNNHWKCHNTSPVCF